MTDVITTFTKAETREINLKSVGIKDYFCKSLGVFVFDFEHDDFPYDIYTKVYKAFNKFNNTKTHWVLDTIADGDILILYKTKAKRG